MSIVTSDIFKRTRAGLEYLEFKLFEYEKEIEKLSLDVAILSEELQRERQPKRDER